jgi:hypothetical protein
MGHLEINSKWVWRKHARYIVIKREYLLIQALKGYALRLVPFVGYAIDK